MEFSQNLTQKEETLIFRVKAFKLSEHLNFICVHAEHSYYMVILIVTTKATYIC